MTPANFGKLIDRIRALWYRKDGLVVLMHVPGSVKFTDVRLVIPPGIMLPSSCLLWYGDRKLYEGPVDDSRLRMALTSVHVCHAVFVRPSRLGHPSGSPKACLGCPDGCRSGARSKCRRRLKLRPKPK